MKHIYNLLFLLMFSTEASSQDQDTNIMLIEKTLNFSLEQIPFISSAKILLEIGMDMGNAYELKSEAQQELKALKVLYEMRKINFAKYKERTLKFFQDEPKFKERKDAIKTKFALIKTNPAQKKALESEIKELLILQNKTFSIVEDKLKKDTEAQISKAYMDLADIWIDKGSKTIDEKSEALELAQIKLYLKDLKFMAFAMADVLFIKAISKLFKVANGTSLAGKMEATPTGLKNGLAKIFSYLENDKVVTVLKATLTQAKINAVVNLSALGGSQVADGIVSSYGSSISEDEKIILTLFIKVCLQSRKTFREMITDPSLMKQTIIRLIQEFSKNTTIGTSKKAGDFFTKSSENKDKGNIAQFDENDLSKAFEVAEKKI